MMLIYKLKLMFLEIFSKTYLALVPASALFYKILSLTGGIKVSKYQMLHFGFLCYIASQRRGEVSIHFMTIGESRLAYEQVGGFSEGSQILGVVSVARE